jgi:hypothetical protein
MIQAEKEEVLQEKIVLSAIFSTTNPRLIKTKEEAEEIWMGGVKCTTSIITERKSIYCSENSQTMSSLPFKAEIGLNHI